jgi:hypothetical protein
MRILAISVEVFGVSSLVAALVKNTIAKRKAERVRDYAKNTLRRF